MKEILGYVLGMCTLLSYQEGFLSSPRTAAKVGVSSFLD